MVTPLVVALRVLLVVIVDNAAGEASTRQIRLYCAGGVAAEIMALPL
jgi:hypothetical protein